jgi:hypothetical protein
MKFTTSGNQSWNRGVGVVVALLALAGCAAPADGGGAAGAAGDEADLTSLRASQAVVTGVGNRFTVLSRVGDVNGEGSHSSFTRSVTLGATYEDSSGYYASHPQTIHVVMTMNTHKVFHGQLAQPKSSQVEQFDVARGANGKYTGTTIHPIFLTGAFGDNDTVLDSVDVAFVAEGNRWDSDFGKNYRVGL